MTFGPLFRRARAPVSIAMTAFAAFVTMRPAHADRYALLAGNSTAHGDFAELKYVRNDIAVLKDILTDFCGFEKTNIVTVYNGTPEDIDRLLAAFAGKMPGTGGDMFLFYYSGHADRNCLRMGGFEYRLDTLKKRLTNFPSDVRIGMFDACQSGSFTRIKGGKLDEPFLFRDDGKTKGQVILCSSSTNENAQESDALGNSIFTFHVVNALRGSGDLSGDGRITLSEAYQYAYNHTISSTAGSTGGVQHPSYQFRIQGEGDIVLADLNVSSRGILLGPDVTGAVTIMNAGNVVVADLTKEKNSGVMIALAPGDYGVINGRGEARYRAAVTVAGSKVVSVHKSDFQPVRNDAGRKKGDRRNGFRFGIGVGGGGAHFNLSPTSLSLEEKFSDMRYFSMDPRLPFRQDLATLLIRLSVRYDDRFEIFIGKGMYSTASSAVFNGYQINSIDSLRYGAQLKVDGYSLGLEFTDIGIGYLFQRRLLKHFAAYIGISSFDPNVSTASVFTDSLYNATVTGNSMTFSGKTLVPFAAIGYELPFARWLALCSNIRVRAGQTEEEIAGIKYDLRGVDGSIYLKLSFPSLHWGWSR